MLGWSTHLLTQNGRGRFGVVDIENYDREKVEKKLPNIIDDAV